MRLSHRLHAPGGATPVNRTLRALALVGLLGSVIYLVGFALYHAAALPIVGASSALGALFVVANAMQIAAWLGTTFTFVAGVVAAVAVVQRRQRRWAVALIGVLALHESYPLLVSYFPQLAEPFRPSPLIAAVDGPLLRVVPAPPLALLVLVYSVLSSPPDAAPASPAGEAAGG
jgi:hypothetical protein